MRVNVELVDARSGQQLWSEQYDRDTADVFAVQSDIALRVADALKASVTLEEQARLGKRPTTSVAATSSWFAPVHRRLGRAVHGSRRRSIFCSRRSKSIRSSPWRTRHWRAATPSLRRTAILPRSARPGRREQSDRPGPATGAGPFRAGLEPPGIGPIARGAESVSKGCRARSELFRGVH